MMIMIIHFLKQLPYVCQRQQRSNLLCINSAWHESPKPFCRETEHVGRVSAKIYIPMTGKPTTKCSGKLSRVFAAKDLLLLDPWKIKRMYCSKSKKTSYEGQGSISKVM